MYRVPRQLTLRSGNNSCHTSLSGPKLVKKRKMKYLCHFESITQTKYTMDRGYKDDSIQRRKFRNRLLFFEIFQFQYLVLFWFRP